MSNLSTSSFKKNLLQFTLFAVVFALCYYAMFFVLSSISYKNKNLLGVIQPKLYFYKNETEKTFFDFDKNTTYDYLFIGGSHAFKSFDTDVFKENKLNTYNLGTPSQTALNSYFILKEHLQNTKKVIYEIYPPVIGMKGFESFNVLCTTTNNYPLLLRTALALEDAQAFELISLKPIISYKVNKQSIALPPAKQGYRGTPYFAKANETFYPAVDLNPAVIDEQMAYLEDIILLCKENNKELIFAYAPIPKQLVVLNEQELFYKNINTLISKHNIKFINMSRSLDLDSEKHFFDNNHLNIDGAKIFSEAFIKELAR